MKQQREELTGVFRSSRYRNEETGYMIGQLSSGESVLGTVADVGLIPGVEYRFIGRWDENPTYGRQFKFDTVIQSEPHSRNGVVQYLKRICPGVGDITAHRLCDLYGENNCIAVLKTSPEKVAEAVPQLRNGKAQEAAEALIKEERFQETRIDLLDLFAGKGFPGSLIEECISEWGIKAAVKVKKDPFCLIAHDMPGCGWLRVDRLYLELGNEPERISRKVVCCWHVAREDRTGSVWIPYEKLADGVRQLITGCQRVENAIEIAVEAGWLTKECVEGDVYLAESSVARDENYVAKRLAVLA